MVVNGRFYVGQNNSLDCRIWSSKNPKKLHMRQRRTSINNLGRRKVSVQLTGFFHHFFWPAWLPLCGLASFYCMFISFGPDPASLGPTGPYEINMQKKLARPHKGSLAGQKKWKKPCQLHRKLSSSAVFLISSLLWCINNYLPATSLAIAVRERSTYIAVNRSTIGNTMISLCLIFPGPNSKVHGTNHLSLVQIQKSMGQMHLALVQMHLALVQIICSRAKCICPW